MTFPLLMTGNMIRSFEISEVKLTEGEAANMFNDHHQKLCTEKKKNTPFFLYNL